jgi:catecholate siderophore receptor
MPSGTARGSITTLALAPTLIGLIGLPAFAEERPAPAPTPVPRAETTPAPAPAPATGTETLQVVGEQDGTLKPSTVTATRLDLDLQHTPQAVTVINQDLLKTTGSFSLRDALRSAPGVTMAAGEGGRTGDSLVIRGFSANSDTYVDSLKDNGQYFRDTFNVQQVEVLKGPSGLLFGRGVTGGAVNTVTKKPTSEWTGEAGVTVGSDKFQRIQAGIGGPLTKDIGGRLDAFHSDADSFRDDVEARRWGVAPTATFKLLDSTDLTLQYVHSYEYSSLDYGVPMIGGRPAPVPINQYYGFRDDSFQEYDVDLYTATIDHRFNQQFAVRNATRYGDYERNYRTEVLGAYNAGTGEVAVSQALRRNVQDNLINNTELSFNDLIDKRKISAVVGVEFSWEQYGFKSKNANPAPAPINVFNPQQPDSNPGVPTNLDWPLNTNTRTKADNIAAYAMVAYEFIDGWTAVLGARFDRYHAEVDNRLTATTVEQTDDMINPRAGLVWDPVEELSLYASYSTSSNPTAETYSISAANANLDPEENVNYEIGAKTELFDRALLLTAAVFRLEKTNARTPDPSNTAVNVLEGVQRSDGFEIGAAGSIGKRWNVFGGYAFMDSEVVESNNSALVDTTPVNAPEHSGSVWVTYNLGWGFDVGAGLYATSGRFTNAANTSSLPGYARFDAGAGWTDGRIYVRLNVFNLADTVYYDAGSTNFANPGAPLTGQLTVGATF